MLKFLIMKIILKNSVIQLKKKLINFHKYLNVDMTRQLF